MSEPFEFDDKQLLDELSKAFDPGETPADLLDVAVGSFDWFDADEHLARIVADEKANVRSHSPSTVEVCEFGDNEVEIDYSGDPVHGALRSPILAGLVLETKARRVSIANDEHGRFSFPQPGEPWRLTITADVRVVLPWVTG